VNLKGRGGGGVRGVILGIDLVRKMEEKGGERIGERGSRKRGERRREEEGGSVQKRLREEGKGIWVERSGAGEGKMDLFVVGLKGENLGESDYLRERILIQ
jgi:hypothetical protein